MGGVLRTGGNQSNWVPFYNGLQIQTCTNGVPIGIVYGSNRISPNVIWTGGFFGFPQYPKSGGKGGGKQVQSYKYYSSFAMGICEGPIQGYGGVWTANMITDFWWAGIAFGAIGTTPQAPWGFLSAEFGSQALNYNGLAYVGSIEYPLGNNTTLPQFSFEVYGRLISSAVVNGYDADPALIIQDFLTNAQYGVLFPASSIDATALLGGSGGSSYQIYCQASHLALSPVISNREAANSIIERWLKITNSAAVWSGGQLKIIPYGDTSITGALQSGANVTFNPNVTPVYSLTDDDFINESGSDPVELMRKDPFALFNWQRLQISQRSNYYDATPIDVWDQNAIDLYGLRMGADMTAAEICDPITGQTAAQLILQRGLISATHTNSGFRLNIAYSNRWIL